MVTNLKNSLSVCSGVARFVGLVGPQMHRLPILLQYGGQNGNMFSSFDGQYAS